MPRRGLILLDALHSKAMKSQLDVVAHIEAAPGEEAMVREVLERYVIPTRLEEGLRCARPETRSRAASIFSGSASR